MVEQQISMRGIKDKAILYAMLTVPRHCFVEDCYRDHAYSDTPLPIPAGQTISQPYVVALMINLLDLKAEDRVLEIGTGSGYAAALLSLIVKEVYTVERHKILVEYAQNRLQGCGYKNVWVFHGDGTLGCPDYSPYDGIIVAAGGPGIPQALRQQLTVGGRIIMPIGKHRNKQVLMRVERESEDKFSEKQMGAVAFVPLIGAEGWN